MNSQPTASSIDRGSPTELMGRSQVAWLLAILGWTTFISFYDLSGGAKFEGTDCWVAQTSREMLERGHWLVPVFSGETRLQKSPGAYWTVMLVSWIRGVAVDEVSTRIPNGIAAVVLVAITYWLALRIAGLRAAVFTGFAAASCGMILYWSHRGASDLGLTAFLTLAVACFWVAANDEFPGWKRNVMFLAAYFFAGIGMLYKLPMPLVCVGLPVFMYVLLWRRWAILLHPIHMVGLLVFLLPWLPWAVMILLKEPTALAKWRVEFLDRFTGDLPNVESQKVWFAYFFYLLPPLTFAAPYSLSIPAAIGRPFRTLPGKQREGLMFMLVWFFSLMAFFTAATGKETRYILPAMPPLMVLLGVELANYFDPQRWVSPAKLLLGRLAVCVLIPASFIFGVYGLQKWQERDVLFEWSQVWPPYVVLAVLFSVGTIVSVTLFCRRARNAAFGTLVGTTLVTWLWAWYALMPILGSQKPDLDFASQLRERIDPALHPYMYQVGYQNPTIIWHSDVRYPRVVDQLELLRLQGGRRSLERERQIVGETMINKLEGSDPALMIITLPDYKKFITEAPRLLEQQGRQMPKTFVWLITRVGHANKKTLLLGNQPPPWPEPTVEWTPSAGDTKPIPNARSST